MASKPWLTLTEELEKLERDDPVVAEAVQRMYDPEYGALARIQRYNRHMAARRAVGKRDEKRSES